MRAKRDLIRVAARCRGIERIEAHFQGNGFSPHRHDTYALGITIAGVQTFRYRGISRFSLPGNVIVLHPDEVHDGGAGNQDGLVYRMLYLPPAIIGKVAGDASLALPFVREPVIDDHVFARALHDLLADLAHAPDDLLVDDALLRIVAGLRRNGSMTPRSGGSTAVNAVSMCKDYLEAHATQPVFAQQLEAVCGINRYELARHFRRHLGTSPHRYLIMRRLELARLQLHAGTPPAEIAVAVGFADQAHFNRHFKKTYGMTPGRWLALSRAS